MQYWSCSRCGTLYPIDDIKHRHNFKLINNEYNIDIILCDNCIKKLKNYQHIITEHHPKYDILNIAKYIILKTKKYNNTITYYNLNRMLFLIWINYYKKNKIYLFDDKFEIDNNYNIKIYKICVYCGYGARPIYIPDTPIIGIEDNDIIFLNNEIKKYLNYTFMEYAEEIDKLNLEYSISDNISIQYNDFESIAKQIYI